MNDRSRNWIEVDWSTFDPWRIQGPFRNHLVEHPLLQSQPLRGLCERLEPVGQYISFDNHAQAGTSFDNVAWTFRNRRTAADTMAQISDAKAWLSLLNVQTDPQYQTLVADVLDPLKPHIDRVDPGMCYRAGWFFFASPHTVTPFHLDTEHNFISQVQGHKTLYVWDHWDQEAASEYVRDEWEAYHTRSKLAWRDDLRARAHVFHLEPGMTAYMPSGSPHLIETDEEPSLTFTVTFYTRSTRRRRALHQVHMRMRKLGITPPAVGAHALLDDVTLAAYHCAHDPYVALRKLAGRRVISEAAPYAVHRAY